MRAPPQGASRSGLLVGWKTGGRRIALSNMYMRSFDRPSAASGSGRSTPGTRKVPTGHLMAFVSPLRRGRLAGRFPREFPVRKRQAAIRALLRRVPSPACLKGIPHAETSSRTAGTDPSPVRRCAPGLPMKGHGQGKGRWRAVDKIGAECRDFGGWRRDYPTRRGRAG